MASIYPIGSGMLYISDWKNPRTGEVVKAHSLGTRDRDEAEIRWAREMLGHVQPLAGAVAASEAPRGQLALGATDETFEAAVAAYVARKSRSWADETKARWAAEIPTILNRPFRHGARPLTLASRRILEFAGPPGAELLQSWADAEIARSASEENPGGRTHTVVKRIACLIKPALRLAWAKGWAGAAQFPLFPELESDYESKGAHDTVLTRAEFVALAGELAHHDAIRPRGRAAPVIGVYPRLAGILHVSSGMHRWDVNRFSTADWDEGGARWYRINSKGARHYEPAWLPCRPLMMQALRDHRARFTPHWCARWDAWDRTQSPPRCKACGRAADIWVRDPGEGALAEDWMRQRLEYACARARLQVVSTIDFRHTFATWCRDEGWEFDEVAKWLGNSTGMVQRVYAQIANERFRRHVENAALTERAMLDMVAINQMGQRRGPRIVRTQFLTRSKRHSEEG